MQYNTTQCNTICFNKIQGNTTQYHNTILYCVVILIYRIIIRHYVVLHYTSVYILMTWQIFEVPVTTTGFHICLPARRIDLCVDPSHELNCRAVANFVRLRYEAQKLALLIVPWRRTLQPKNGACWIKGTVGDMSAIMTWKAVCSWTRFDWEIPAESGGFCSCDMWWYVLNCFKNFFGDLTTSVMCWLRTVPAACRVLQPMFLFRI